MPEISEQKQRSLSQEKMRQLFDYEPETGYFYRKVTRGQQPNGSIACRENDRGYRVVTIDRRPFLAHRLAWFWSYGEWPQAQLDHINGDRGDNRIINLRLADAGSNRFWVGYLRHLQGRKVGIRFWKNGWEANIKINGRTIYLGRFQSEEEAQEAYLQAAKNHWPEVVAVAVPEVIAVLPTARPFQRKQAPSVDLTIERLRRCLSYNPDTGVFVRLHQDQGRSRIGEVAGQVRLDREGYRVIKLDRRAYLAHRLAWFWVHGEWPAGYVDHINGIPDDNRIANLRCTDASENAVNRRRFKNNTSGYRGVWPRGDRWAAGIYMRGQRKHLGLFGTPEEANEARLAAATKWHGDFARLE